MDLIAKIQSGKGDETFMFYGHKNLYVELMFAGTIPKEITQDYSKGNNDLYAARSARWSYTIENKPLSEGYTKEWSMDFELYIQEQVSQWGERSEFLDVAIFSKDAWQA